MSETRPLTDIERAIDSIQVGTRFRSDLGDIDALMASIEKTGLLQPITVTPDGVLVSGQRRLAALRKLGQRTTRVWVRQGISEPADLMAAQLDENATHKPLNPVEQAALYRAAKAHFERLAAQRKAATQFRTSPDDTEPMEGVSAGGAGGGESPPPAGELKSRHKAALLVNGSAGYKRHEQVGALERIRDDENQDPQIRQAAGDALTRIEGGAAVQPLYDTIKTHLAAKAAAGGRSVPTGHTAAPGRPRQAAPRATGPVAPRRGTIRGFLMTIATLDGWAEAFDADDVGRGMTDEEWDRFDRVRAQLDRFAVVAKAGREAARAQRVTP
ncbi:ParB/RepB/Spo0J family partition protein [Xylanimonas protaetiae]|uniref:Chromosome partitioning protein ParB n=1 Tax=Xylanimonas protaetiae TaxID=2509457 RepID=A0A4P6EYW2_9MICO|nr:ParB N-terminal domain-containing protein [Xylanimonas protaetiae]QAY68630.1 chromosome partitioning protein ParB [Xylanimonas protaetiae]